MIRFGLMPCICERRIPKVQVLRIVADAKIR
eukprot:CAMPEP_0115171476 /NCGR_PEP_ID=MMETSP0270-20121206/2322_1 /TAXON_ID=71861 /ORGANISM="Scrippsiella trochoidea, Strain CCMP3099" /LENGTH=30 /DNA_ID= /DNA_START= /DNA_END= /DNA_ORIENTATION=